MYFEAVEDIVKRLSSTKLKSGTRTNLQKQLQELDPHGIIRTFLSGTTERPGVSIKGKRYPYGLSLRYLIIFETRWLIDVSYLIVLNSFLL